MRVVLKAALALAFMAYPLGVYFGLARFGVAPIALLLAALALLRLSLARGERGLQAASIAALIIALVIAAGSLVTGDGAWLRYYPTFVNLAALAAFGWSLIHPPSIIERLARLRTPQLPEAAVRWTRGVTQVWCVFFALNADVAFYTARFASMKSWTLYNGFIAYVLIGMLLLGEYLLRPREGRSR